jgi:hypothetical protein
LNLNETCHIVIECAFIDRVEPLKPYALFALIETEIEPRAVQYDAVKFRARILSFFLLRYQPLQRSVHYAVHIIQVSEFVAVSWTFS